MYPLLAQFLRLLPAKRADRHTSIARGLMERAGARAGTNPRQARELRQAALAYISVVR